MTVTWQHQDLIPVVFPLHCSVILSAMTAHLSLPQTDGLPTRRRSPDPASGGLGQGKGHPLSSVYSFKYRDI